MSLKKPKKANAYNAMIAMKYVGECEKYPGVGFTDDIQFFVLRFIVPVTIFDII